MTNALTDSASLPRVLVTGANGFVGSRLCEELTRQGYSVRAAVRRQNENLNELNGRLRSMVVPDLLHFADWPRLLRGIDVVVHLVARTHVTDEYGMSGMQEYRRTNVELTRRLAKASLREGVSRFVFLSSIKAVGNGASEAYTEMSDCQPEDSYGKSKLEAEIELRHHLSGSACEPVILRPPLVYGPNVRGNFLRLLKLVDRGIPLPNVRNARSMVHIDNLVSAIELCLRSPGAVDKTFHCADPEPISTGDLVRSMAEGLGRSSRLVSTPESMLRGLGNLFGKTEEIKRLVGSLTVSSSRLTNELDWQPKWNTADGVVQTSRAYRESPWSEKQSDKQAASQADVKRSRAA